jgi:hypothetical protein
MTCSELMYKFEVVIYPCRWFRPADFGIPDPDQSDFSSKLYRV